MKLRRLPGLAATPARHESADLSDEFMRALRPTVAAAADDVAYAGRREVKEAVSGRDVLTCGAHDGQGVRPFVPGDAGKHM